MKTRYFVETNPKITDKCNVWRKTGNKIEFSDKYDFHRERWTTSVFADLKALKDPLAELKEVTVEELALIM